MGRRPGDKLRVTRMAKKFDGSGVVGIQCSQGVFTSLKLANMPVPRDWGQMVNGIRVVYMDTRGHGVDGERYRVIWPEPTPGPGRKYRTSSFTLTSAHSNETLYVLAEFLRDQGVEFVALANKHGNAFSDIRLHGTNLAYLTRDIPHSPACHVDFAQTHPPEVSGTTRGIVANTSLNG